MGAQKGKDLLLKVDFDQTATFATVAGMRTKRCMLLARSYTLYRVSAAIGAKNATAP